VVEILLTLMDLWVMGENTQTQMQVQNELHEFFYPCLNIIVREVVRRLVLLTSRWILRSEILILFVTFSG
jgi:hypothetical protein